MVGWTIRLRCDHCNRLGDIVLFNHTVGKLCFLCLKQKLRQCVQLGLIRWSKALRILKSTHSIQNCEVAYINRQWIRMIRS